MFYCSVIRTIVPKSGPIITVFSSHKWRQCNEIVRQFQSAYRLSHQARKSLELMQVNGTLGSSTINGRSQHVSLY